MADLSITAANCIAGSDANTERGIAGATITAGQACYKEATTGLWKLADSDSATAEVRIATGIALNGAALNQPLVVQKGGSLTLGATMTAGLAYYLSKANPGGICPVADIASGGYSLIIGIATSTTVMALEFKYSGVAV